ncbi:MAG TPA: sulfate transporter, partial [Lachnoclostridium sp.]|nr:sulfate transporter [Lachnoclostridium sp.]
IALMLGIFAGAAPGTALVSYAETVAATEANQPAEGTSEDFGVNFFIWFFGGITHLILFVVVVVVCSSISAVGVFDAQGEE